MELELQKYLRGGGKPEDLTAKYAIKVNRHPTFPNLTLFKYDQIDSPMGEPIVQESRGIILNEADNWNVLCYSYRKFFNRGEGHAAEIDMNTAKIYDKLDGSLMQMFYYGGEWRIASSGTPDAGGNVYGSNKTFSELFWEVWKGLGYELPKDMGYSYSFELMTPLNRIVCVYDKPRIVLHGVRNLNTLQEQEPEAFAEKNGWECVKSFKANSLEDVAAMAAALDPIKNEGYVAVDANFNRQKIKNPAYVSLAHMKDSMGSSKKRMVEVVRNGESSEFLSVFPEFVEIYNEVKTKFDALVIDAEATFAANKDIEVQKDFAMAVKDKPYASIMFMMRKNKNLTVRQALKDMRVESLANILGVE
jgi:hypothetical protein